MTVINPPGFLQNAGATHTAEQFRNWHGLLLAGKATSTSLIPRGGINPALGNQLQVTQTGSPSQAVIVKSGHAMIPGSEGSKQGAYAVMNDADVTLSVTAAHATLNRIDSVVFKVQDTAYSGAVNTSSLVMVDGTPASSPSPPTLPSNCIELARVSVLAASTSVVTGSITDMRQYFAATGGIIQATSSTRPGANTIPTGQVIFETNTSKFQASSDSGTTWSELLVPYIARQTVSGSVAASIVFSSIPSSLRRLELHWNARGDTAATTVDVRVRINGDAGAAYLSENLRASSTTPQAQQNAGSANSMQIGETTAASAGANTFGAGILWLPGWDWVRAAGGLSGNYTSHVSAGALYSTGGVYYTNNGPYTSLTILPGSGNFAIGSDFQIIGWRT